VKLVPEQSCDVEIGRYDRDRFIRNRDNINECNQYNVTETQDKKREVEVTLRDRTEADIARKGIREPR
jgi:hypothetical protein